MNVIKYVCAIAFSSLVTGVVFAETTNLAFDSSPLTPGARIVAGDLSKNEFFILGKDDQQPIIRTAANRTYSANPKPFLKEIKTAANQKRSARVPALAPQITAALNKAFKSAPPIETTSHMAANANHTINKLALNNEPSHIIPQKKPQLANKFSSHKIVQRKTHFYSFKQSRQKHHARIASNKRGTQHFAHRRLASVKHYKFVSLTKSRHSLKIKTAFENNHTQKRVTVAKI